MEYFPPDLHDLDEDEEIRIELTNESDIAGSFKELYIYSIVNR